MDTDLLLAVIGYDALAKKINMFIFRRSQVEAESK